MFGPSWWVGKGIKSGLVALGCDPISATIIARSAHVGSSLIFHDHHTHFHPYGDEHEVVGDVIQSGSDHHDAFVDQNDLARSGGQTVHLSIPREWGEPHHALTSDARGIDFCHHSHYDGETGTLSNSTPLQTTQMDHVHKGPYKKVLMDSCHQWHDILSKDIKEARNYPSVV